jgi:hypothetical protein
MSPDSQQQPHKQHESPEKKDKDMKQGEHSPQQHEKEQGQQPGKMKEGTEQHSTNK